MSSVFLLVIGAVIVAIIAFLLRQAGGGSVEAQDGVEAGEDSAASDAPAPAGDGGDGIEPDDEEDEDSGYIAISSDGYTFLPRTHSVLISPRAGSQAMDAIPEQRPNVLLQAGDLIGTRIVRGAPDVDPWRLEALGRDRDLSEWVFETEEAARAAQESLERVVVQPPFDADGEPVTVGDEDFWVAEQERQRTLAELELPDEPEEEPLR